jgi:NADH:ubiquinone oxidoreductase subunit
MLMGMVVFGTYNALVHTWKKHYNRKEEESRRNRLGGEDNAHPNPMDGAAPIWLHGIAGAASGVSRSLFWVGWERFVYDIPHSLAFSWRTIIHHAIGHGMLFGGYYGLRTILLEIRTKKSAIRGNEDEDYYPIVASFIAGGWAGQLHHMVQHYTSHWRDFRVRLHQSPRPPRIRSIMTAFAPMAMCFAAFEHGAEGVEVLLDQIQSVL